MLIPYRWNMKEYLAIQGCTAIVIILLLVLPTIYRRLVAYRMKK